jgi:tetratricopeptide (TPR) repeat protein
MKTLILLLLLVSSVFSLPARGQQLSTSQSSTPKAGENDREHDGLKGLVRRVRVESANILEKDGKTVEGPRVLRSTVTYDMQGKRIDTVSYPVETGTPAINPQYRYDDKGNVIEKVVRTSDGSIVGKETFEYEFDEFGNWEKMTTSVAVYENGKVSSEPVEVTYRTIVYYYSEPIEKISSGSRPNSEATANATSSSPQLKKPEPVTTAQGSPTPGSATAAKDNANSPAAASAKDQNKNAIESTTAKNIEAPANVAGTSSEPPKTSESQPVPNTKVEGKAVTEEQLRKAAISLPEPEYPTTAEFVGRGGKVDVQIIVNEKGEVVAAKGVSGESLLYAAAEAAALKAHFAPNMLSQEPARVFGIISYRFNPLGPTATVAQPANEITRPIPGAATKPAATSTSPAGDANSFYQKGLAHLRAGRNSDALEALRQAVYLNPQDAIAYGKLGLAYSALGQHQEAIAAFKIAINIKPDSLDAEENYRLGEDYTAIGKHSEALKAFKQALHVARPEAIAPESSKAKEFPTVADLHFGLGLAYYNTGNFGESIKELKITIIHSPDLAEAHYGIALAYIARGERAAAQHEETILRKLNPTLADNIAAALPSVVPPGTTRIAPRDDRKPRP